MMSTRMTPQCSASERLQHWIPVCLAAVGLVLAIRLRNFFYLPAIFDCSALVMAFIGLWKEVKSGLLLVAVLLVAVALAVFSVLPWWRDRELRVFWSDFRQDGGQVGVGGSVVLALDGNRCWDYIGVQDGQAMAEVLAELHRMGCKPEHWTTGEQYNAAQREQIQRAADQGHPFQELLDLLKRLDVNTRDTCARNTVLVGGPTVNQVSLAVLAKIHPELANAQDARRAMQSLETGYAFVMADKPEGANHGPNGYHAFGWERHEVAQAFPNCHNLLSHGIAKIASPGRIFSLFETERVTLNAGREVGCTTLPADYGLVVRLRYRDADSKRWRTLLLVMGWRGLGTLAAARATMNPRFVRMMNEEEANLLDKIGPKEACCTELLVRTGMTGDPVLATDQAATWLADTSPAKLENPSARCVQWR